MNKSKYLFVFLMLLAIFLASGIFTMAYVSLEDRQEKENNLQVVTSFYPVYIAALNVAGECKDVSLTNLSEPQTGCMHDYQLTPQDMILLSQADLFLVNGGGIENFLAETAEAYPELTISQALEGVELLSEEEAEEEGHQDGAHVHDEENAHAWMDTRRYGEMVQNIAKAFGSADPENRQTYQSNADLYCKQIEDLTHQIEELRELANGEPVVILHEAYAYVAQELGMDNLYCLNLDEERQVSAGEAAEVIRQIKNHKVKLVIAEELYGKDLGNTLEAETGAEVCYLDTLVRGDYQKDSYLESVQRNIDILRRIWQSAE